MALTSAFFDAKLVGGEYDRVYSAERFAEYFASFIANGVFPNPATNLQVVANVPGNMAILVKSGLGWINGYYCNNDGDYPLTLSPANGTLPRVDAVVLRWSRSNRSMSLEVKTGVATSSPSAPPLERSADNYELMLASISVVAGATSIAQASITDKRPDSTVCGWVKGVVDQIDTTNLFAQYDDAFQTWFSDLRLQLNENVVTNLQNKITALEKNKADVSAVTNLQSQITTLESNKVDKDEGTNLQNQITALANNKVNASDKASTTQAQAGTDDTKWMTPAKVKSWWENLYKTLILSVAKGGTGKSSWSADRLIYPSAATTLAQLAFPSQAGAFLKQNTSGAPYWGYSSETGKYTGQGRTGENSPNTISFAHGIPKVVLIKQANLAVVRWGLLLITPSASTGFSQIESGTMSSLTVSISEKTVSWYYKSTDSHPANQLDAKGGTFVYVGIF